MHRISRPLVGALVLIAAPSAAAADVLSLAPSSLSITIGNLAPISLPSNPATIAVSSGAGTFAETAFVFGPADVPLPRSLFTGISLLSGLTLVGFGNGGQLCTRPDPLRCTGGLAGTTLVNVLQIFNLSIPLSVVGSPGATVRVEAGGIMVTVTGQSWVAGTATVTFPSTTPSGTAIQEAIETGFDDRTPNHNGALVLVSGFRLVTGVAGVLPGFAVQTLNFAPEPESRLLIAASVGSIGLYALARRRRR